VSILVNSETRLVVQGITGREGMFHAQQMQDYGTNIVAGVTPGKGGQSALDKPVPVFDTVAEAVEQAGANTSVIYVPAPGAPDAILEAVGSGIKTVFCITEHIPALDMLRVVPIVDEHGARLVGPNCPGATSVGQAKVGIIPGSIHHPGRVGVVSRSGTLTYEVVQALTAAGIGQSTCVGIGGDPINGSNFVDILKLFRDDPDTDAVVLIGEIGGDAEERAADWIRDNMSDTPMASFIAGRTAPAGRRMGHAGAIISGNRGTAESKVAALEAAGVRVAEAPSQIPQFLREAGVQPS
jgi:succinyl-CoA synthetase alpha subunit